MASTFSGQLFRRWGFLCFSIAGCGLAFFLSSGCATPKLKIHPIKGKVELTGGDVALLKGSNVEFMQDADPMIRPTGVLAEDGSFSVQTQYEGELLSGAPEGSYKARIILADEGDEGIPKRPANVIHRRFLDFATSGLTVTVPSSEYKIAVSSK